MNNYTPLVISRNDKNKQLTIIKGTVQPFEPKGMTRLIRSGVKNWRSSNFFNDTISREEHKTIYSGLRISEMTFSNQSHFPQFIVSPESHLIGLQYPFYCCLNLFCSFYFHLYHYPGALSRDSSWGLPYSRPAYYHLS
jgi:hypothetical protein